MTKSVRFLSLMCVAGFQILTFSNVAAAHPVDVPLLDMNGLSVTDAAGLKFYSPKQTCSVNAGCHENIGQRYGLANIYEGAVASVRKDHGPGTVSYDSPAVLHGVSSGYIFQEGRDTPYGDVAREYYGHTAFSSSPGMFGRFCPATNGQLADLTETDPDSFGLSGYDYTHSACGWCHPGGGPMEYDRDGYRYDGQDGIFHAGSNPAPKPGDYYSFENGMLVDKTYEWSAYGVSEVDCLMCHMRRSTPADAWYGATGDYRYSLVERNHALSEMKRPNIAASAGLAGPAGSSGLLQIVQQGAPGIKPVVGDPDSDWSWRELDGRGVGVVPKELIVRKPEKESCSQCHFPDHDFTVEGPGGTALGFTVFQDLFLAGTAADTDEIVGVNGQDGLNDQDWKIAKGRTELDKRANSVNDPQNPDVHMDAGMQCADCHYALGGRVDKNGDGIVEPVQFSPIYDSAGELVLPGLDVLAIDHKFAKGNSRPDGDVLNQLDNTLTCASCHIERTHPNIVENGGVWDAPMPMHSGFPVGMFNQIDCRTCHIPRLNNRRKQYIADYTAGPYQDGDRAQYLTKEVDGVPQPIDYKPLYVWLEDVRVVGKRQITPVATTVIPIWVDGGPMSPTFQRLAVDVARAFQLQSGDNDNDGIYDWTVNRPQNGDKALIVNTTDEIGSFVDELRQNHGVADPVMYLYVNMYTTSHNVAPLDNPLPGGAVLGSRAGGGCVMCHSSSDVSKRSYNDKSVGLFDKQHVLFKQPVDGGQGLQMTCDGGNCATGTKRLAGSIDFLCSDYNTEKDRAVFSLNLNDDGTAIDNGQPIKNMIPQQAILCFSKAKTNDLMWSSNYVPGAVPDIDGDGAADNSLLMARLSATTAWGRNAAQDVILVPLAIAVDATGSACNDDQGEPTNCTCSFTVPGATVDPAVNAACKGTIATSGEGIFNVTVKITRTSDGVTSSKTLQAAAVAAMSKPSISTANIINNGDCTADVVVTSTNASSLLVNCGNSKAEFATANFSAGTATATCDYKNKYNVCAGTEAAVIAIVKDAKGTASDSVTINPEYNPQPPNP